MMIIGGKAPAFSLPDQNGTVRSLADYLGKWMLIYFYPKDDTPGCTIEAKSVRDEFPHFEKLSAVVLGISTDPVASHEKFAKKYDLPFTLLSDEQKAVVESYGVWGAKKFMGREYEGTLRTSFLIDPEGKIAKIYEGVKPAEHVAEVLADLKRLTS
ncbi:MAG: thioredoxin-dependent thiol peroxidase [bacterium]